ncbi:hypothetical protein YQE_04326, partial [Dendroctonus ponderosae]
MSRYNSDCKVYVGDLGNSASKQEIEDAFRHYGPLRNVWVARNPPGFAFVEFEDPRDAEDAVRGLDGRSICGRRARVEMSNGKAGSNRSRGPPPRSRGRPFHPDDRCYECGDRGHYARDCGKYRRGGRQLEADPEVVLAIEELAPEAIRAHAAGPGRVDPDQLLRRVEAAPDPTGMIGDPGRALTPGAGRP